MIASKGSLGWHGRAAVLVAVVVGLLGLGTGARGGYAVGRVACHLSDPRITESSGVASASWSDDVLWTHNDSGDEPRFFAVDTTTCAVRAVYDVAGARAVDWEDMARAATTLHFADIGDNDARRASVIVYDLPEPAADAPSGSVRPSATRVLTYPDGPHNAESLFVDPTTGRLAILTKAPPGETAVYLAPASGNGVMERVTGLAVSSATGADAIAGRVIVRDYLSAYEWTVWPGDTLAHALARIPGPVALPVTPQGEAISYARDGSGLWTTSERQDSPVHFVSAADVPPSPPTQTPVSASPGSTGDDLSTPSTRSRGDRPVLLVLAIGATTGLAGVLITRTARRRRASASG